MKLVTYLYMVSKIIICKKIRKCHYFINGFWISCNNYHWNIFMKFTLVLKYIYNIELILMGLKWVFSKKKFIGKNFEIVIIVTSIYINAKINMLSFIFFCLFVCPRLLLLWVDKDNFQKLKMFVVPFSKLINDSFKQ